MAISDLPYRHSGSAIDGRGKIAPVGSMHHAGSARAQASILPPLRTDVHHTGTSVGVGHVPPVHTHATTVARARAFPLAWGLGRPCAQAVGTRPDDTRATGPCDCVVRVRPLRGVLETGRDHRVCVWPSHRGERRPLRPRGESMAKKRPGDHQRRPHLSAVPARSRLIRRRPSWWRAVPGQVYRLIARGDGLDPHLAALAAHRDQARSAVIIYSCRRQECPLVHARPPFGLTRDCSHGRPSPRDSASNGGDATNAKRSRGSGAAWDAGSGR